MKVLISRLTLFFAVGGIFYFTGCGSPPTQTVSISRNGPPSLHFVKEDMIEKGVRLKDQFPGEEFYGTNNEVLVEFYLEGEESGSHGLYVYPKDLFKSLKKDEEKTEDDQLMTTRIKARVTYFNTILSLQDWNQFSDGIPYTKGERVGNLLVSYNAEMNQWFYPTVFDRTMEDRSIFYSDARMKIFEVPAYTLGTQISYTYTVNYDNINYLANVFFTEYYPQEKKVVTFAIPEWLDISFVEKNFGKYQIERTDTKLRKSKISELRDYLGDEHDVIKNNKPSRKKKTVKREEDKVTYVTFEARNLPASVREEGASGPTHNLPHLLLHTKKYTDREGKENKVLSDMNDLYGWYRTLVSKVNNDSTVMRKKALEITEGKKTDQEKIEAIFYWVQDNIRYIAFEDGIAGFKPDACQKVLNNRYGDCKGMANLTTQMLKSIGFDARLTWIGTRRIAYDYSVPSIAVDNHMICTVMLNGKRYFLDPTESFIAFGDYAHRIQGRQVLIENGDNYIIDSIPDLGYERNKNEKTEKLRLEGKTLVGDAKETYRGESKTFLLYAFNSIKSDRKNNFTERFLSKEDLNIKLNNIQHNELSERTRNIEFTYQMKVLNHVISKGSDTYINAEWEYDQADLVLDSTRLTDYEFDAKMFVTKETRIAVPKGSKIKYVPAPVSVNHEYFRLELSYKLVGNELVYTKSIIFPHAKIPMKYSADWNRVQKQLGVFYRDYVILTN